jgi:hypothetical protein
MLMLLQLLQFILVVAAQVNETITPTVSPTNQTAPVPVSTPVTVIATGNVSVPTISPTKEPNTTLTPIPAPVPDRPCYTDLVEIADKLKLKNPFTLETYIFCPGTFFQMGTVDPTTDEVLNGYRAIFTRSNSIFQCGEDGKSSNNCTIYGGEYHVFHELPSYNRESKVNVVMKGLTFVNATGGSVVLAAPGDITFIDCIFRVSSLKLYRRLHI